MDHDTKVAMLDQYDAVRRKLNITWEDDDTEARVRDVIASVSPALAARCGLESDHLFVPGEQEWPLFLNACLYEFSNALDDFWTNYGPEVAACHLRHIAGGGDA